MAEKDSPDEIARFHLADAQRAVDLADQIFLRLSSWLVAGHGVTTLLLLNAVLDRKICVAGAISETASNAFVGLLAAFAAAAMTRWSLLADAEFRRQWARVVFNPNKVDELPSRSTAQALGRIAFAALLLSSGMFVFNLWDALTLEWFAAAQCPPATP